MTDKIEFIDLKRQYAELKDSIGERMQTVLDHGQYIMGPEVLELEQSLARYIGVEHCITVSSGTEALLMSLMALGVGRGDEVITTPFTFAATAEVIALVGATPVFVDIESDTYNIDVNLIEAAITQKTKAIMPVSLYGQPADMHELTALAERHDNIPVIEDAAQSFGAGYRNKMSCGISTIGCTSFFPSKPLGCYGDGGAIFTADGNLAKIMREIRVHGQERRYVHSRVGVGGRMDTLQCAIVLAKFERFAWEVERRSALGEQYLALLGNVPGVDLPTVRSDRTSVWAQFTVRVGEREAVIERLREVGIPTAVHYPLPLHLQPAYKDRGRVVGSLRNTTAAAETVMSLPFHPYMDRDTLSRIAEGLDDAVSRSGAT